MGLRRIHLNPILATHLPALFDAMCATTGPVLELGSGIYSTPLIHWWCRQSERLVVSCETDARYYGYVKGYETPWHRVLLVDDWDAVDVSPPWSVVLVDHAPPARRAVDLARVTHAEYVVVHDTHEEELYHYAEAASLYRYRRVYRDMGIGTTVFSNQHDPKNLGSQRAVTGAKPPAYDAIQKVTDAEMRDTQPGKSRRYTMCRAIREAYVMCDDEEVRKRLRYACTLAEAITKKVDQHDPGWLRAFYPRRHHIHDWWKENQ